MPRGQSFRDVHVDKPLSNFSIAHWQDTDQFVCQKFFNVIPVTNASDVYTTYPQGYFNRVYDTRRSEEGLANTVGYKTKDEKYSVDEDALRIFISDKKRANADSHRVLDEEASRVVTDAIMLGKEVEFADQFLSETSPWTVKYKGTVAAQAQWDGTNGDPIKEVLKAQVEMVKHGSGRRPNKGIITLDLYVELRERADFLERVFGMGSNDRPGMISLKAMAALFELDELLIMQTVQNIATDGIEDPGTGLPPVENAFVTDKTFFMAHVPAGSGLFTATAGTTFAWNQYIPHGLNAGPAIRRYRPQDGRKGEFIEAELAIDQRVVSPDLGVLWTNMLPG